MVDPQEFDRIKAELTLANTLIGECVNDFINLKINRKTFDERIATDGAAKGETKFIWAILSRDRGRRSQGTQTALRQHAEMRINCSNPSMRLYVRYRNTRTTELPQNTRQRRKSDFSTQCIYSLKY